MIHERLGVIWKRIYLYKKILVLTIAFNVFTALSGGICSYLVWKGAFDLSQKIQSQDQSIKKLEGFEKSLLALPPIEENKKLTRTEAFREIQAWEKLRWQAEELKLSQAEELPPDYLTNAVAAQAWLLKIRSELEEQKTTGQTEIYNLAKREDVLSSALMWLGALTIIFGVAIPLLISSLIVKALRHAQNALTDAAKDIVKKWSETLGRYGEEPFKNAHFWIEAILIFGEQMGHHSAHPAAALTSELSYLVREELHRNKEKAA